jgi:hypothetical protein
MADTRTAAEINNEIARFRDAQAESKDAGHRRHLEVMIQERLRDLRALDDTPEIPFRPASVFPSGRPPSGPVAAPRSNTRPTGPRGPRAR